MTFRIKYVICPECGKEGLLFTQEILMSEPVKMLCSNCRKRKETKKRDRLTTVASDIPAGGGATIDLFYNPKTHLFLEEKTLPSGEVQKRSFGREDFEAEKYRLRKNVFLEMS